MSKSTTWYIKDENAKHWMTVTLEENEILMSYRGLVYKYELSNKEPTYELTESA